MAVRFMMDRTAIGFCITSSWNSLLRRATNCDAAPPLGKCYGLTYLRIPFTITDMKVDWQVLHREVLLAFWKVHILHHASEQPIVGNWMMKELRSHGYDVSPGTLYPLLKRMVAHGWLEFETEGNGPRARKLYRITPLGLDVLEVIRAQMAELVGEVKPAPLRRERTTTKVKPQVNR
jgi:DNA-binding PadR family transcriptional regulator